MRKLLIAAAALLTYLCWPAKAQSPSYPPYVLAHVPSYSERIEGTIFKLNDQGCEIYVGVGYYANAIVLGRGCR